MKVLSIAFDNGEYAIRLASALAAKAQVCLMVPEDQAAPHVKWLDPAIDFRPFQKPRLRQPLQQLYTMLTLLRRIKAYDPDVIYLQKAHLWFNITLPLLRRYPLVISIHDPRDHSGDKHSKKTPQFIKDFGYRRADQIIVHCQSMKPIAAIKIGIPPEKIHVVPLMVAGDQNAQSHIQELPNQILFFGRIWHYKGLEYLIRAEPYITAAIPNARIVIAGQGDDFAQYRKMMRTPEHFVVYNQYISAEVQAELFRQSAVVALPYIEATQSGVIPVAYNFAKPVVATAVGGMAEQVDNGKTGFLIPPCNEQRLAECIIHLLRHPALRHQMGQNGQQKLQTEWSSDTIAQQTIQAYQRAIAGREKFASQLVEKREERRL